MSKLQIVFIYKAKNDLCINDQNLSLCHGVTLSKNESLFTFYWDIGESLIKWHQPIFQYKLIKSLVY